MPLAEAAALAAVHCELYDPQADRATLSRLAAWCEQFSPIVGIEGSDTFSLNVTGLGPMFGDEESLAQQAAKAFQSLGYLARIAIADTLGGAWGIAHFGNDFVVSPGRTTEVLAELPLVALRLPENLIETLSELGIQRIGGLLRLPRQALATRFDSQLLVRLDQATGLVPEPIVSHRPPPEIVADMVLEYPLTNRQSVDAVLTQLVERIRQPLVDRQQGVLQLEFQLQCGLADSVKVSVGLFRATANPRHLLELTQMQLERLKVPGPITAVKLSVLASAPLESRQQELFETSTQQNRRQVALLVDRLSNRLGRNNVVRAVPQADAQPEYAFRYEALTGALPRRGKEHSFKPLPRPLRLEPKPVPLEAFSVVPAGPPICFGDHRVARSWGPERIQFGWWRGGYIQRDYYRVETTTGKRFWLFRRLSDGKWFWHGAFD